MSTSNREIDLQAAEWAVRLESGALTAREQAEFDEWLAANLRHRGALLRWRAAAVDVHRLAALAGHQRRSTGDTRPASATRAFYGAFATRRWFLAASVAGLAVTGVSAWWIVGRRRVYVSDIGEIQRVALADGSTMVLNTATEATVHFDKAYREIELARGEGLFEVAKDPARPFIVRAGHVAVRAVGTVFSVRSLDEQIDVTVTEGVVEIVENGGASNGQVLRRVGTNESATVMEARQVQVQPIRHDEAIRRLAWRDGMLAFAGETLTSAADEINRHNRRHVVIDDADLAGRQVDGLFRADDPEGFADTVATALGAKRVDYDDAIHLQSRPSR